MKFYRNDYNPYTKNTAKSAVVYGKGDLAVRISEYFLNSREYELKAVVPVLPEPDWCQSLVSWARRNEVPVIKKHDDAFLRSDIAFSVFYNKIFRKDEILKHTRFYNIHNSPLPNYRGMNPINWALKNGEISHGVTIHQIDSNIDTGDVIARITYSIYPEIDEVRDVYGRSIMYGWTLFLQTIPIIDRIKPLPQSVFGSNGSYYSADDAAKLGERRSWTRSLSE